MSEPMSDEELDSLRRSVFNVFGSEHKGQTVVRLLAEVDRLRSLVVAADEILRGWLRNHSQEVKVCVNGSRVAYAETTEFLESRSLVADLGEGEGSEMLAPYPNPAPKPPQTAESKPKRSCNRHDDCDAADVKIRELGGNPYVAHCHSDDCEDCFGS